MKKIIKILMITTAICLPHLVAARPVTINAQVVPYTGPGAFVVVYLTGPDKKFHSTIWLAYKEEKYLPNLFGWHRHALRAGMKIDGVTGASVGANSTLTINTDIADGPIDAGYSIHVDAAAEDIGMSAKDISLPLTSKQDTLHVAGKKFITSFSIKM